MHASAPGPHRRQRLGGPLSLTAAALFFLTLPAMVPQSEQAAGRQAAVPRADAVRYDRDVRPILADRCFTCHGPDAAKRKADLRLDDPASALSERDGVRALVAGDPDASELWRRITTDDPDDHMPPPDSGKRALSADERAVVRTWIEQGAVYEPHWSFVPPTRPAVPPVRDTAWARNDIDRFVLANLERHAAVPSPAADRATLARRVYLTLTGLPPTPEEIDAFVADPAADAVAALARRLLTEEPYRSRCAEHAAAPWLDAARYADTIGIHTDAGQQLWPYRDWVLRAFRDNLPFDRFLTEQIAGDLLPDATREQKVATGFLRAHVITDEGGAIAEEYLVEYAVDRASTVGSVMLGLTVGCARCHEHKYDPISHDEFYRFYAFFNSVQEPGLYSQQSDPNRAFEPFLVVPSPEQTAELEFLKQELDRARAELDQPLPGEDEQRAAFISDVRQRAGVRWADATLAAAASSGGATLTPQPDGSVLASGKNPARDDHSFTLRTDATDLRLLLLEAIPDPSLAEGRIGRAPNGNAVLSAVEVEAVSLADPQQRRAVPLVWAMADHEQQNGDFAATNVLDPSADVGWAVAAHQVPGGRALLLLSDQPFGYPGGTEVVVRLRYQSVYSQHALGRVRLSLGQLGPDGLDLLPAARSYWYVTGPFPVASGQEAWDKAFGPEQQERLDRRQNFGFGNQTWRLDPELKDGRQNGLPEGLGVVYVGSRVFAPSARSVALSLGSDDGFRLFVAGAEVAGRQVDRGLAADQDRAEVALPAGESLLCMKVVNTGGAAGFYLRPADRDGELAGGLFQALLPDAALVPERQQALALAWRLRFSPGFAQRRQRVDELQKAVTALEAALPRTMVMQELPEPRPTFVLQRGAYDHPDRSRPVTRGVPAALGALPPDAPSDRRGLAQWLCAPDNPLVARVAVNRLWERVFGIGLVATTEDFGMQGEWPSHPELLDWLAVELRESGWDLQHLLVLILDSATFQQASRARPDLRERDPDNRWLAYFPRRRLSAEQLRDQALFVSGLLAERLGGPSVKPYQPEGLWQEVAMLQSNTRNYQRGKGDDLYRRSLYTYWKRASPPPTLLTLDAPTREFCTVRRLTTNTPLQALVLWNDPQFVEAARMLAARVLGEDGDEGARLAALFRRCTGERPDAATQDRLAQALAGFRARYRAAADDARALLAVGEAPAPADLEPAELAAWTLLANACLNLDATLCTD